MTTAIVQVKPAPLTNLAAMESVIERGLTAFVEVGQALRAIRDQQLYRDRGYGTFEAYCREQWGMERRHPYRLIDAARVTDILCPVGHILPSNERVARPLTPLLDTPEKLRDAWTETIENAPRREDGQPIVTAKDVTEAVARIRHVTTNPGPFPGHGYRVLYADPPWRYEYERPGHGAASDHYPTMFTDNIKNLHDGDDAPIGNVAATDSVLFLWSTCPFLPDALSVIEAWGFPYKTSLVWDKVLHNFGYYVSVRHELLLIATRGSCTPDSKTLHDSVVTIERTKKHSEKPGRFREIIDEMYTVPDGFINGIELFARGTLPEHWDSYGNELSRRNLQPTTRSGA